MTSKNVLVLAVCSLIASPLAASSVEQGSAVSRSSIVLSSENTLVADAGGVSANHPLAARAGLEILQRGGNAVDAMIATVLAMTVVQNSANGLGGYGGAMVIHLKTLSQPIVVDFNTRAPLAATADMFYATGADSNAGIRSVSLWNTVAGLAVALERYGTMPWNQVIQPAIRYAEEGFVIDERFAVSLNATYGRKLSKWPANRQVFRRPDGTPLEAGDRLVQPDLGKSLRTLAAEGPDAIYTGDLARAMVAYIQSEGGVITLEDLANWRERHVRLLRPAHTSYRGYDVYTSPLGTGGQNVITVLNLLKGFDLPGMGFSAKSVHLILEAFKLGFADRLWYAGDPWMNKVPYAGIMSDAYADDRRKLIDPDVAWPYARPGDPWKHDAPGLERFLTESGQAAVEPFQPLEPDWLPPMIARNIPPMAEVGDTASTSTVDKDGNMVALTMTMRDGYGSGVMVPGTGIILNNGMGLFHPTESDREPVAGHPNRIEGGKLALNNMNAFLVFKDGKPFMTGGGSGGRRIITECLELIIGTLDWGLDVQEAVALPRFHVEQKEPAALEAKMPYGLAKELEEMGHRFEVQSPWGGVHAIQIDPATGLFHIAREPRSSSSTAGGLVSPK